MTNLFYSTIKKTTILTKNTKLCTLYLCFLIWIVLVLGSRVEQQHM